MHGDRSRLWAWECIRCKLSCKLELRVQDIVKPVAHDLLCATWFILGQALRMGMQPKEDDKNEKQPAVEPPMMYWDGVLTSNRCILELTRYWDCSNVCMMICHLLLLSLSL